MGETTTNRTGDSPWLVTLLYMPLPMVVIGCFTFLSLLLSEHDTALVVSGLCCLIGMIAAVPLAIVAVYLGWTRRRAVFWGAVGGNTLVIAFDAMWLTAAYLDAR